MWALEERIHAGMNEAYMEHAGESGNRARGAGPAGGPAASLPGATLDRLYRSPGERRRDGTVTSQLRRARRSWLQHAPAMSPSMSSTRRTLVRALALVAVAAVAPATLIAQTAAPAGSGEHTVRRGDTLWHLAGRCLGDPFRWPELHQANRSVVENPHRIYPGERLAMPCGAPTDATATRPADDREVATVGGVEVLGDGPILEATVQPALPADGLAERRRQEYLSAPYAAPSGAPQGAGRVHALSGDAPTARDRGRSLALGDQVRIELPFGATQEPGARFIAITRESGRAGGGEYGLDRTAQVVRPTGVVELEKVEGGLVRGRVVQVIGSIHDGQELLPVPAIPATGTGTAGAAARVAWVEDGALLPSVQDWVILEPTGVNTLVDGDRVEMLHPVTDASGAVLGMEVVATARVVRATALGATALITTVRRPLVAVGAPVRVVVSDD